MNRKTGRAIGVVLLSVVVISGCGMTKASQRPPTPIAILKPIPPEKMAPRKGSIWQTSDRNTLFLDNKARNVGDIVTVTITEKSAAAKTANTKLDRKNDSQFSLTGAFDLSRLFKADDLNVSGVAGGTAGAGGVASSGHKFEGKADTDRESALKATISCVVTEVLSNGNLRIEGRQDITVNHENQFIIVSGVIRPEDISPRNTVSSSQMADARIEYGGEGDADSQQQPSWLNRFFSSVNLI